MLAGGAGRAVHAATTAAGRVVAQLRLRGHLHLLPGIREASQQHQSRAAVSIAPTNCTLMLLVQI